MKYKFENCDFKIIKDIIINENVFVSSPVDTFAESKIFNSNHYQIVLEDKVIGYGSINCGCTITFFHILNKYKNHSQEVFAAFKKIEYVSEALVATCDESFLSLALDNFTKIEKQAYFFKYKNNYNIENYLNITYRLATLDDLEIINKKCDTGEHFFDDKLESQLAKNEIYIGYLSEEIVAFGILERSILSEKNASIGMYTLKEHRNKKIGKITLFHMIKECEKLGLEPISGCWYFNHFSKKSLESVGLVSDTRYLKIIFN